MTEPSRQTGARRRRAMLALARSLEQTYGSDESLVIATLADGWTICRVVRLEDQLREGELMRNCLRDLRKPCGNVWSLRDSYGLPHLCFSVWSIDEGDDLSEVPDNVGVAHMHAVFIKGARAVLQVDSTRAGVKAEHETRLRAFADGDVAGETEPFPRDTAQRILVLMNVLDPTYEHHVDLGDRAAFRW